MKTTILTLLSLVSLTSLATASAAELDRLIKKTVLTAFAGEISGVTAKRNLDRITLYHRTRASSQFRQAAEHIASQLKSYGYQNTQILQFPADGESMFGTQRARLGWDVEFAELWELNADGERVRRLANWDAMPLSVAQDSLSGKVTTTLVDIGPGTNEADYLGKDIDGALVLTSSQPEAVAALAVARFGAAGIVSYAPNQKSAWWQEDARLVRWGHLSSFPSDEVKTFAFMISLAQARVYQQRLTTGESIQLAAEIRAHHSTATYDIVTATIEGADPAVREEEVVFTCHLDHPRPGANDNASGCVAILEAARAIKKMIADGVLKPPRRSLRFLWPAEIEGSLVYLNGRPDLAARAIANIHLDMVGGKPATKAVFRVSGGPMSLPSFISDLGHAVGGFVNHHSETYASGGDTPFPLTSAEGGKEPLLALFEGISLGSDHQVFNEGSWRIPGIYLHDWPDRYIHTNFDTAAMIDPTKLKRAAFIAALTGWYLADMDREDVPGMLALLRANSLLRARAMMTQAATLPAGSQGALQRVYLDIEQAKLDSVADYAALENLQLMEAKQHVHRLAALTLPAMAESPGDGTSPVYYRNPNIKGPMHAFGYSYLEDKLDAASLKTLTLPSDVAYEALNLVDGLRSIRTIHNWLNAEFGAVDYQAVETYLAALASINVLTTVDQSTRR